MAARAGWMHDAPIIKKLMGVGLLIFAIALTSISAVLTARGWIEGRSRMVSDLETYAGVIGSNAAIPIMFDDRASATETLSALRAIPSITYAAVYDKQGKSFAVFQTPRHGAIPVDPQSVTGGYRFGSGNLDLSRPILFKGKDLGLIYLRADLRPLYLSMAKDGAMIFGIALMVFLVAMFLFARLQKRIVAPLGDLADVMQDISLRQDFTVRAGYRSRDEVGVLAQVFNSMLDRIQTRDAELAGHRDLLKQQVAQRTDDLQRVNVALEQELAERIRAEQALHDSEEQFRVMSAAAFDALIMINGNGVIGYWNSAAERIFGYAAEEALGEDLHAMLAPKRYYDDYRNGVNHFKATGEGAAIGKVLELAAIRKNGMEFPVELSVSAARLKGEWVGIGILRDITERTRIHDALQESEERFRQAFETAAIGMALVGLDGRWLKVNPSICRIVGYSESELLSRTFQDITHPEELRADLDYVAQLLAGEIGHYHMEKRYIHREGHTVWALLGVSLVRDTQGHPIHFVSQIEDITERKRVEERIRKLNQELEVKVSERTRQLLDAQDELVRKEKLAVLGQVAGSVGHELRNPLAVMSNAVYFLQTVLSDGDDMVKEYLGIIKEEIGGAERIVSDLLDSVRTKPPSRQLIPVAQLIETTLRKCGIPESVEVRLDLPESIAPLEIDPQQMQQVFRNLIMNACDAMPDGGTLTIDADAAEAYVTIRVRDTGIGLSPDNLEKLFQPLFTTKARGIGLGLVVVKNLTQANGGRVEVSSEEGRGTTFSITLPSAGR